MPKVTRPTPAATYHEGRPNQVISLVEVKTYMIKFTDDQGKEEIAQVQVFGTDEEDGGTGVWVIANQQELIEQLRGASKHVRRGVRAQLKELLGDLSEDDLPEDLGAVDLGTDNEETLTSPAQGNTLDTAQL